MNYGFVRVAAAVPKIKVADCDYNGANIIDMVSKAQETGAQFVVFPELSVTGYTCGDLFHQEALLKSSIAVLENIVNKTKDFDITILLGLPLRLDNQLFNCGVVLNKGTILGVVPKTYVPNYNEFYEERWFASGKKVRSSEIKLCGQQIAFGTDIIFESNEVCFGIEICEDLWVPAAPSSFLALAGAELIFNLSASNEVVGKFEYRRELVRQQSARCIAAYVYSSAGAFESTTDVVFGGHAMIAENGAIFCETERYAHNEQLIVTDVDIERLNNDRAKNTSFMEGASEKRYRKIQFDLKVSSFDKLERHVDQFPFVPSNIHTRDERCKEIFSIQTAGLGKRILHTGLKNVVIGISGGLDSTLALLAVAKTYDGLGLPKENIICVTMPGFGTTNTTYDNAIQLMKCMGVSIKEIDIKPACIQHFKDIGHDIDIHDVTYENVQARERTQILMDIANKYGGLVIGTGDLSELALGWCTYNGDHISMYSVNCGIPKTLVRFLVAWVADNLMDVSTKDVLHKIIDTPISPELLPPEENGEIKQKTEDIVGPYELHDFFMYHMIRYGASPKKILFLAEHAFEGVYKQDTIKKWLKMFLKRFFTQQFKRSCLPDGPKVGTISLSPRGDWRMPSDSVANIWLKELE